MHEMEPDESLVRRGQRRIATCGFELLLLSAAIFLPCVSNESPDRSSRLTRWRNMVGSQSLDIDAESFVASDRGVQHPEFRYLRLLKGSVSINATRPANTAVNLLANQPDGRMPVIMVLSVGRDGSTLLFNMLRFILESQYVAVKSGYIKELPPSQWIHWVDELQMPVLVKTHELPAQWFQMERPSDLTPLIDLVFTVHRDPVEAVCSHLRYLQKHLNISAVDKALLLKMLRERHTNELHVAQSAGGRLALQVDFERLRQRNRWDGLVEQLETLLGVRFPIRENIIHRLSLLRSWQHPSNDTTMQHPVTLMHPDHRSDDAGGDKQRFQEQCLRLARAELPAILVEEPLLLHWIRSGGLTGSSSSAPHAPYPSPYFIPFLAQPVPMRSASGAVVSCVRGAAGGPLSCAEVEHEGGAAADAGRAGSTDEVGAPGREAEAGASEMGDGAVERILGALFRHHCGGGASRRLVVEVGGAGSAAQALAAGCDAVIVDAEPRVSAEVGRRAAGEAYEGTLAVLQGRAAPSGRAGEEGAGSEWALESCGREAEEAEGAGEGHGDGESGRCWGGVREGARVRLEEVLVGRGGVLRVHGGAAEAGVGGMGGWLREFGFEDAVVEFRGGKDRGAVVRGLLDGCGDRASEVISWGEEQGREGERAAGEWWEHSGLAVTSLPALSSSLRGVWLHCAEE